MAANPVAKFANHAAPVDRAAARVIGRGVQYQPATKGADCDSDLPLKIAKFTIKNATGGFVDLTGKRIGRLEVLGISQDSQGSRWVCRCDCGRYTIRIAKSIKNPENTQDRCSHCRHLAFLKCQDERRQTGKDVDIRKF